VNLQTLISNDDTGGDGHVTVVAVNQIQQSVVCLFLDSIFCELGLSRVVAERLT